MDSPSCSQTSAKIIPSDRLYIAKGLYVNPTLLSGCYREWSLLYMRNVSIRLAQHPS